MSGVSGESQDGAPPGWALLSCSSGTAVASVCIFGVFDLQARVGGVWAVAAVVMAGLLCQLLARRVARLYAVCPSGAGLIAQISRALGRSAALVAVLPYLLLTLCLVGAESALCGLVLAQVLPIPAPLGSLLFLGATWALCRRGVRLGQVAQAVCTGALFVGLIALATALMIDAASRGLLLARLSAPTPSFAALAAATGQALFLFMGFELVTFQAGGRASRRIGAVLGLSVALLTGFYAAVALGVACLPVAFERGVLAAPQMLLAGHGGGRVAMVAIGAVSLLASYTSFNGALLALSRLAAALSAQGLLPRALARVEPRSQVPRRALDALLVISVVATAVVLTSGAILPPILAAAAAAAAMYAAAALARERPPFREAHRGRARRGFGVALAGGLVALGIGAVLDAPSLRDLVAATSLLALAYVGALALARRAARRRSER
jgi:GABA permease